MSCIIIALASVKLNILFSCDPMNAIWIALKRVIPMHIERKCVKMPNLRFVADLVI